MNLLLSAVGCDPFGGSEGIYGWYVVNALAKCHDCYVITQLGNRKNIEEAARMGLVSPKLHFRYFGIRSGYHGNRLIARFQNWRRYQHFQKEVLSLAREWHAEVNFDIAQHVTYTSWRVPSPLWKLGIPFVWGPLSGTEPFPFRFLSTLSLSSKIFEIIRLIQGWLALWGSAVADCARNAVSIPVPHSQALDFLTRIRGSRKGVEICHNFFFPDCRIKELQTKRDSIKGMVPLRAFASGNLEGRKGVALALGAIAEAKKRGVRVDYHVTSRGPELHHLQKLANSLGIQEQVILGERFEASDYASALGSFDLCLLPTLRDGAGLSIMEAMLAGCVPIVADWCGPAEFVIGSCGFKIPVTDPEQMVRDIADVLCALDADRERLLVLGDSARRRIMESYNEHQFVEAMNRIYASSVA